MKNFKKFYKTDAAKRELLDGLKQNIFKHMQENDLVLASCTHYFDGMNDADVLYFQILERVMDLKDIVFFSCGKKKVSEEEYHLEFITLADKDIVSQRWCGPICTGLDVVKDGCGQGIWDIISNNRKKSIFNIFH